MKFAEKHIGISQYDKEQMLQEIGVSSLDELVVEAIPEDICYSGDFTLSAITPDGGISEYKTLQRAKELAGKNKVFRSLIGCGFADTIMPSPILRNILDNPSWYTQYTPYQPEISQGRLEALFIFQTMCSDLTGLPIANASLLDEATAIAEASSMALRVLNKRSDNFSKKKLVISSCAHPQNIAVLQTRMEALGCEVEVASLGSGYELSEDTAGVIFQYPDTFGSLEINLELIKKAKDEGVIVIFVSDLLALSVITPPALLGADIVVGSTQRFGLPLGFGGPHSAYLTCKEIYKRYVPGRIVGLSKDKYGKPAYRLALQTREQHIRRDKATSNICTAQVLPAILSDMYSVYHSWAGDKEIASSIATSAFVFNHYLKEGGYNCSNGNFFDTVKISFNDWNEARSILNKAYQSKFNFRAEHDAGVISITFDELTDRDELLALLGIFNITASKEELDSRLSKGVQGKKNALGDFEREGDILTHKIFSSYNTESEFTRYVKSLEKKDLSLTHSMIPLGSCTMKLNSATEMFTIAFEGFSRIHPFAPKEQVSGYLELISELEYALLQITGMDAVSFQPNAGSQGEYAGLLAIKRYLLSIGEKNRDICLIPESAHGTNPASAVMAGLKVVVVQCDKEGNIDIEDLQKKAEEYSNRLAALMITYPSTHGVFEEQVTKICDIMHQNNAFVYMDGANLNAMVGLARPGDFGADICHINLHKTFCIPHGGGGPGMGPIACKKVLADFLPGHPFAFNNSHKGAVSSSPFGSPNILPISWAYILMMGAKGLIEASKIAILNANYIAKKLSPYYKVLYRGKRGKVAHECIISLREFKNSYGIEAMDVAKRLMDFGFHAPTVSFPVVNTMMIEPTESESKREIDRFCQALIKIREEIASTIKEDNQGSILKNAPHTIADLLRDSWDRPYSKKEAVYPLEWVEERKFWPAVNRIDDAYGDRCFVCCLS